MPHAALVVASRFGLLLGLSAWLGMALAALLVLPLFRRGPTEGEPATLALSATRRLDVGLVVAAVAVVGALGARGAIDHAAPPASLFIPVAGMLIARVTKLWALAPALRALDARRRNAQAPATAAETAASRRLSDGALLLLTVEVCLGLYAVFAVS